jgi:GWxTD domain-containing protein
MRRRSLVLIGLAFFSSFVAPSVTRAQVQLNNQEGMVDVEESDLARWLTPLYRNWLTEDVPYIITKQERWAFLQLTSDEDRDLFIEQFWQRRNPDPDSRENTFKEEHYRRIAYANENFGSKIPGWETDRGRIYIMWGPPEEIVSHPSCGTYERSAEEGGGETSTYAFEDWRYRYLEGLGENVVVEFVDAHCAGDYVLTPSEERDRLFHIEDPSNVIVTGQVENILRSLAFYGEGITEFVTRFPDLEALAVSHFSRNDIDFTYHFATVPVTSFTALAQLTIEVSSFEFRRQANETALPIRLNFYCRIADADGRIVETLEDTIPQSAADSTNQDSAGAYLLQKTVPLSPGLYDVAIVLGNPQSGDVGSDYSELTVLAKGVQK